MLLRRNPALQVTLLGGRLGTEVSATFGEGTIAEIDRLQLDWAVVSPTSLDPRLGAMNYDWQEATVARAMLAHARQRLLLADAAKLGQSSRVQVCACSAIDLLITEAGVASRQAAGSDLRGQDQVGVGAVDANFREDVVRGETG